MKVLVFALGLVLAGSAGAATVGGPATLTQGACFTATWSGIASPASQDWIGVFGLGAANGSYQAYQYTGGGASGSLSLWIPLTTTPGNYQLRLFSNNSYTLLATGTTFTVATPPSPSVSSGSTMVGQGGTVTVTWSNIPCLAATGADWIGMYAPGAASNPIATGYWRNTTGTGSGSVPFTVPSGAALGTYEFRLFKNNTYTLYATSSTFAVVPNLSGTVTVGGSPLAGVSLSATSGASCTSSNASGQYSCVVPSGWSGDVTPSITGYLFTPPSRTYSNITASQTAQNFTAAPAYVVNGTVTAGGSALANVSMAATNGGVCTSSNGSGQYSCNVPGAWSGSITPTLGGYTFAPASRSYTNVNSNLSAQNFAAADQIAGTVTLNGSPLSGVTFTTTNGGSCTPSNGSGQYGCSVPYGWSGTVTAAGLGYAFTPASRSFTNVTSNQPAQDFIAAAAFQVSGTVTLNGLPLPNVAFAATSGPACSTSNHLGQYACTVPQGWSGTVTPSASGYSFAPASRNFTNVTSHQTNQSFAAALDTATAPIYFVHVDHLNTPREIYDASAQLRWKWDQQEAFGVNVPDENPSSLGAFEFALRFPGQYADRETNLHYNYFRDYDPSLGRYVQSDPIGLDGGLNTYAYVDSSPLDSDDVEGLQKRNGGNPRPNVSNTGQGAWQGQRGIWYRGQFYPRFGGGGGQSPVQAVPRSGYNQCPIPLAGTPGQNPAGNTRTKTVMTGSASNYFLQNAVRNGWQVQTQSNGTIIASGPAVSGGTIQIRFMANGNVNIDLFPGLPNTNTTIHFSN